MVRDVQATPADRVEIYSTAQQRVVGVTDKSGRYTIEVRKMIYLFSANPDI